MKPGDIILYDSKRSLMLGIFAGNTHYGNVVEAIISNSETVGMENAFEKRRPVGYSLLGGNFWISSSLHSTDTVLGNMFAFSKKKQKSLCTVFMGSDLNAIWYVVDSLKFKLKNK